MLTALLAQIIEWLISKGIIAAEGYFSKWRAEQSSASTETADVAALANAVKGSDLNAIAQDGQDVLNGTKPTPSK